MIKVLYDHEIFSEQLYGGISRYFANLAQEINKTDTVKISIAICYVKNYYVRDFKQPYNNLIGRWFLRKDAKRCRWNRKYSERRLGKSAFDIFHATYYDTYSLDYNNKPMVITIHDMIHEDSPQMFANSEKIIEQKRQMMHTASAIIAISNYTKSKIVNHYPEYESKISVVYHGLPNSDYTSTKLNASIPERFLLFVGERGNYKSFEPFVLAVVELLKADKNLKIVAAGAKPFSETELAFLSAYGIAGQCIQLHAGDELLAHLYQNAALFVYPSTQEGFGLPLLEAFKNNCAIACSDSSCLPEIGGEAVAYFNTYNSDSILSAVRKVLTDREYANELKLAGKQRLKIFTMQECVERTIKVYRKTLSPIS